ncbi:MAG: hypothetical protein AAFY35_15515 [Pseudomonadota bacterium]
MLVWGAIIWSVIAILWLAQINPKRRRVFGFEPLPGPPAAWPGWVLCGLPGLVLLLVGTNADLVNWMGAVCAFGWMIVAVTPAGAARAVAWLDNAGKAFEAHMQSRLK